MYQLTCTNSENISEMTKPLSNQKNINTNGIKTNKDIEILMDSNIDPKKCDDNLLHDYFYFYFCKIK